MSKLIGIGVYQKGQWPLLLETADDADLMIAAYDEWLRGIEKLIENIKTVGIEPVKVEIDVYELLAYCRQYNVKNNGETRSQFIVELLNNGRSKDIKNDLPEGRRLSRRRVFQLNETTKR
jgi:hypothetical protein